MIKMSKLILLESSFPTCFLYAVHHVEFLLFSGNDDFEDAEDDDNMDEMEPQDDDAQIDLLQQGEGGAGQLQTKRITTPYMTK